MVGGIRFEHSHRLVAGTVGFLTLILTVWIEMTETRKRVRWLAIACLGAVVLQGILGGLTVLFRLPAPISVAHACLGPIFFCLTVCLAMLLKVRTPSNLEIVPELETEELKRFRLHSTLTALSIFFQMLLGSVVRHTGGDVWIHVLWAFVVLMMTGSLVTRAANHFGEDRQIFRPALFLGFLVVAEFFLGIGAFVSTRIAGIQPGLTQVLFPTVHQTLGALILATSVVLTLRPSSKQLASTVSA